MDKIKIERDFMMDRGISDKMYFLNGFLIFCLLLFCPLDGFAKIYKWVDKNGQIHLSDAPSVDQEQKDVKEYKGPERERAAEKCNIAEMKVLISFTRVDLKYMTAKKWRRHRDKIHKAVMCLKCGWRNCRHLRSKSQQYADCVQKQFGMKFKDMTKLYEGLMKQLVLLDVTADD